MKVLFVFALFGCMAAPALSGLSNDILAAGNWEQETGIMTTNDLDDIDYIDDDDVVVDFGRGVFDKTKDKLKDVIKEIPVMKSCKCDDKQCGCCLIFMTEEKNASSCITVEAMKDAAKDGVQFTLEIGSKIKKEVFMNQKTHCYDFETGVLFACVKPYGAITNKEGVRGCIQLSLKIAKFKIVSADLDCFRIKGGKLTREKPKDDERPKKGILNKIVSSLTKKKDENKQ